MKGDLHLSWVGDKLVIDRRLATSKEVEMVEAWLDGNKLPRPEGYKKTDEQSTITAPTEQLREAMHDLIKREVGEAGWAVFAFNKRGKGKVIARGDIEKGALLKDEITEIAKVKQVGGG